MLCLGACGSREGGDALQTKTRENCVGMFTTCRSLTRLIPVWIKSGILTDKVSFFSTYDLTVIHCFGSLGVVGPGGIVK